MLLHHVHVDDSDSMFLFSAGSLPYFRSLDPISLVAIFPDGQIRWYPIQLVKTACDIQVTCLSNNILIKSNVFLWL